MGYNFIWKVKNKIVKTELAQNCYLRDIIYKKHDLAIKYNVKYKEISMQYEEVIS